MLEWAHVGLSDNGLIAENVIAFNQSFSQQLAVSGGGLYIAGQAGLELGEISPGAGSVTIDGNLIHGNMAGSGDGGGIAMVRANGCRHRGFGQCGELVPL